MRIIIDTNNRFLLRFLTFVPPALGIIVFTYFIKFYNGILVTERLPLYQGLSAYFALILIGFTYIKKKSAIWGKKTILFLSPILVVPILFYIYSYQHFFIVILFSFIFFFSSISSYLMLVNDQMFYYLLVRSINSLLLPSVLILNYFFLTLFFFIWLVFIIFLLKKVKTKLEDFDFTNIGSNLLKSILAQSPFLLLPFFDYKIASIIGAANYANYVLIYKYINGGITVLFSYKQLNLVFGGKINKTKEIAILLAGLLITIGICTFIKGYYIFILILILYSIGVNYGSLIIRKRLLNGVSFIIPLLSFSFVIFYIISLNYFDKYISLNNSLFILLMASCTIIPSVISAIPRIFKKNHN